MPKDSQHDIQASANTRTTSDGKGRLYSLRAIWFATFFGTFLAGGFLVARNYKQFAQRDASRNAMLLGVVGLIGVAIAAQFMPMPDDYDYGLVIIIAGTQATIAQSIAKRFQGELLKHHEAAGGQFHSLWRASGISLLLLPLTVLVLFCSGFFISAVLGQQADTWSPLEDSCWTTCEWPTELPACFHEPGVARYAPLISSAFNTELPDGECVCASWRLTAEGMPYALDIRGTSDNAERLVEQAFADATPFAPVPDDAICLVKTILRSSFGGSGPL